MNFPSQRLQESPKNLIVLIGAYSMELRESRATLLGHPLKVSFDRVPIPCWKSGFVLITDIGLLVLLNGLENLLDNTLGPNDLI